MKCYCCLLAVVTAQFNELTEQHPIGREQPPITVDEICGVIQRHVRIAKNISDKNKQQILALAKSKFLHPGDSLKFSTEQWLDDIHVTMWRVDLIVDGYKLAVRDRMISSRPQSDLEKKMHEELLKGLNEALEKSMEKQKQRIRRVTR